MSKPSPHLTTEPTAADRQNSRLGLWLFAGYCSAYGLFVLLAAFSPTTMALRVGGRVNLAITYGFGLIVLAFILAIIYLVICSRRAKGDAS
jgi:uncharacterized membrane protein (DUF485 family)